jgi:hypothetical protein
MNLMALENRFPRTAVLVLVFALLAAVCGKQAHSAAGGDADLRELSRYQLTMADIRKFEAANASLAEHPKAEHDDDDAEDQDKGDNESLDEMAARIESNPIARKAVEAAGLSARQYVVITMALFQASLAQYAVDQGADPGKIARETGVNPANIRFVKEHKAELEQIENLSSGD